MVWMIFMYIDYGQFMKEGAFFFGIRYNDVGYQNLSLYVENVTLIAFFPNDADASIMKFDHI